MALFKDNHFIQDVWQALPEAQERVLSDGYFIIPMARWSDLRASVLSQTNAHIGLALAPDTNVLALTDDIKNLGSRLKLITIVFPKFADGRGFSQAMLLRTRLYYQEELRAVGDVLWDELTFLLRCGVNAFEIENAPTLARLKKAHNIGATLDQHLFYQPGLLAGEKKVIGRPWLRALGKV